MKSKTKIHTMNDCLPDFFSYQRAKKIAATDPKAAQKLSHSPQSINSCPKMKLTTVDAVLENVTRYSPDAAATSGGKPRVKKIGLKITPPPRPKAPASSPPKKPIDTNSGTEDLVILISD